MFGNRVKIDGELFDKLKKCAEKAGYASTDEFVTHVLEKEVARLLAEEQQRDPEEEVRRRLQGLGYIE